jgi:hypothetical protein
MILTNNNWTINDAFHSIMGTISLLAQLSLLILFYVSIRLKRRGNLIWHGYTMLLAVEINTITFLLVMAPSLVQFWVERRTSPTFTLSAIHGVVGGVAETLSLWLVVNWAAKGLMQGFTPRLCTSRGKYMKATMIIWVIAVILGIGVYILHVIYDL